MQALITCKIFFNQIPMNYYLAVLKNYAVFSGRARRAEFWYFVLLNLIISIALSFVGNAIGFSMLSLIYTLAVFIPSLAVAIRRLHDIGKSGWWILIGLIPLIGWIWLIILYCIDSNLGKNAYGPNPKGK